MKKSRIDKHVSKNQPFLFDEPEPVEDWNFNGQDTRYLTHGLHPYLASMIPQIPNKLLSMYAESGMQFLDPFVGGGATVVEASLAGLHSTGVDVNPLAIIISKAKTTPLPHKVLIETLQIFDKVYFEIETDVPTFPNQSRIDYWFKPYTFEPLAKIRASIDEVCQRVAGAFYRELKNLLLCIFSNTVRDVSLTYRGEVRLRRLRQRDLERFNPDVFGEFKTHMKDAFSRVSLLPSNENIPYIYESDVKNLPFSDGEFDLIITSPPYGDIKNTIPYHQFSKNMLYWLGLGTPAIDQIRKLSLGAKQVDKESPPSDAFHTTLDQMNKPNLIHEAVCFYSDYYDALIEMTRVTAERIIIVIGHRILDGVVIDNPKITTEMMAAIGWDIETRFD